MALWGWIAAAYGAFLAATAITLPTLKRRPVLFAASLAYCLAALGTATLPVFWVQLVVPAVLLLSGYWLSGLFFTSVQPWFEDWLRQTDQRIFRRFRIDQRLGAAPRWFFELLEASYVSVHVVVAAGAVIAALNGIEAVARYWAIVLGAELACYAPLPYFRSRPPRAVEAPGVLAQRAPRLRRLNGAILDHTSVQVNTIPSGHVAGALAATLATFAVNEVAGLVLMAGAAMITAAAVLGRYHYVIDCALGVGVAVAAALLVA